jgi:phage gp36-like protein
MAVGSYIDAAALQTALTPRTYIELYAPDPQTDTISTPAVEQDINDAEAIVDSYLLGFYTYPLDPQTDRLVRAAARLIAKAFAFMRHPEYVRTFGEVGKVSFYVEGIAMLTRIQAGKQRLPDQVAKPKNLGGVVSNPGPILIGNDPGDF